MINLQLDNDEGILLERPCSFVNGKPVSTYLTHKNIITAREYGFFKTKWQIIKYPLSNLKIINGDAQATLSNAPYKYIIRLMFLDKIIEIDFQRVQTSHTKHASAVNLILKFSHKFYPFIIKYLLTHIPFEQKFSLRQAR